MSVIRFLNDQITDKPKQIEIYQYSIYQYELILKAYRNNLRNFKRNTNSVEVPYIWKNFVNFTSWYKSKGLPYLLDKNGDLLLPWDSKDPYCLCPKNPNTLISRWQRKILNLNAVPRGANTSVLYLEVEEYHTGKIFKFRVNENLNLDLFKRKLVFDYFKQISEVTLFEKQSIKSVTHFFKEAHDGI